jgi:WD40 repeat protein
MTGNYIATASDDGKAGIWKLGTGTNEGELIRLSREIISNVVASPSGEVLALSDDGTAYLIDPDEARVIEHLRGHDGPLLAAAIYDGGQSILTCSRDNTARIWDLGGLQIGKTIVHEDGNRMMSSSFSPNGGFILSTNGNTKLWALDGTLKNTMIGETHSVFSRDGQMILTAGYSGERNRLYNSVGESLKELNLRQFRVYFTPENNLLTDDGGVYSQNEELLYSLNGHGSRTNSATYSPDGAYVVTASWDESAILWKKDGTLMQRLTGHTDRVNSGDISPDQKWILTTSADQTIKLWDFAGNLVRTYGGHGCGDNDFSGGTAGDCGINDGQFSPTGRFFATGGDDGVLIMRDLEGTLVSTIQGHKRAIIALDFSTQGDKIMTAGHDNEIKIWYTPAGIADWLETAEIDQLSPQDRLKYNIEG